jgi:hypothetical protein
MHIQIVHLDRRTEFESLRDNLLACGIDISSLKVVGAHSDSPATANESSVLAAVRDVYEGCPSSEGHLRIYAEKVLRGGVIVRLDLHDERQFDIVQNSELGAWNFPERRIARLLTRHRSIGLKQHIGRAHAGSSS